MYSVKALQHYKASFVCGGTVQEISYPLVFRLPTSMIYATSFSWCWAGNQPPLMVAYRWCCDTVLKWKNYSTFRRLTEDDFVRLGIDAQLRAENLGVAEFARITNECSWRDQHLGLDYEKINVHLGSSIITFYLPRRMGCQGSANGVVKLGMLWNLSWIF